MNVIISLIALGLQTAALLWSIARAQVNAKRHAEQQVAVLETRLIRIESTIDNRLAPLWDDFVNRQSRRVRS